MRRRRRTSGARSSQRRIESTSSLTNAVPRSYFSVTFVTRQPSFSAPTRFATGTRTSVRNTSANSDEPSTVFSGRTSMPGRSIGRISHEMPAVLRRVGIGAHEELADVGDLAERAPDLLAVEHVVVAVAIGARAQRREVGTGARLGEALAPHLVAAQDPRQVRGLLRVGALFDERRARVQRADEVHADVRRLGPRRLLVEDQLLGRRRAAPAVLLRPVQPRVPGVEQPPLPVGVPLPPLGPRVARRLRRERRQRRVEPRAQLGAEALRRRPSSAAPRGRSLRV